MNNLTPAQKTPQNIEVDIRQREVRITWQDGVQHTFTFDDLRRICPCAVCNELRRSDDPLRILTPDQQVVNADLLPARPVEMVGNYGLQFFWQDGHNSGIYAFDYLRQMGDGQETG
ncbi:MAG: DUF971 domain-containing protein [Chloroflexi bacterium]|nr:MAG: DUF971 domain-containing protein [Chloroflexota bacterium]